MAPLLYLTLQLLSLPLHILQLRYQLLHLLRSVLLRFPKALNGHPVLLSIAPVPVHDAVSLAHGNGDEPGIFFPLILGDLQLRPQLPHLFLKPSDLLLAFFYRRVGVLVCRIERIEVLGQGRDFKRSLIRLFPLLPQHVVHPVSFILLLVELVDVLIPVLLYRLYFVLLHFNRLLQPTHPLKHFLEFLPHLDLLLVRRLKDGLVDGRSDLVKLSNQRLFLRRGHFSY
mmetsp:Transcript_1028/g.1794  ORF Transcript_1028/g.1794 Transcript_1028/m.1794 type:complete len:227 (+) Transcript_1028:1858-2538(+)